MLRELSENAETLEFALLKCPMEHLVLKLSLNALTEHSRKAFTFTFSKHPKTVC